MESATKIKIALPTGATASTTSTIGWADFTKIWWSVNTAPIVSTGTLVTGFEGDNLAHYVDFGVFDPNDTSRRLRTGAVSSSPLVSIDRDIATSLRRELTLADACRPRHRRSCDSVRTNENTLVARTSSFSPQSVAITQVGWSAPFTMYETSEPHGLRVGDLAFGGYTRLMVVHTPTDKRFADRGCLCRHENWPQRSVAASRAAAPDTTYGNSARIFSKSQQVLAP